MKKTLLTLLLLTVLPGAALRAQEVSADHSSVNIRRSQFLALGAMSGLVLHTNDYVNDNGGPSHYTAASLKYGFSSTGNCWEDIAYGMPYGGVGFYAAKYHGVSNGQVGTPMSLFVFQGGTIARLNPRLAFNYEWDLGMSFGWKPYDPFDNPYNIAIGSTVNVHISFDFYFKWAMSPLLDLNAGINLSHFSNGDSRLPNAGFNLAAPSLALVCHFNREEHRYSYDECYTPPPFRRRIDHDISLTITSRQATVDTTGTGRPSPYLDRKFKVLGFGYALLFANTYKYKWGPALDFVYDESSYVRAWRQVNPADGKVYDRVALGPQSDRVSLGLAVKGELTMPHYSIFANLGWNMIYGNRADNRLYQILGLKVYLKDNLFGTFGIRASKFSSAQYLYWSLGYTIAGRTRKG